MFNSHQKRVQKFIDCTEHRKATEQEERIFRDTYSATYDAKYRASVIACVFLIIITAALFIYNYTKFDGHNATFMFWCVVMWFVVFARGYDALKYHQDVNIILETQLFSIDGTIEVIVPSRFDGCASVKFTAEDGTEYPELLDVKRRKLQDGMSVSLVVMSTMLRDNFVKYYLSHIVIGD
jgi:hypothetical protein